MLQRGSGELSDAELVDRPSGCSPQNYVESMN